MLGRLLARLWSSIFVPKSKIMMRTGLVVVGLGTLAVMELVTPSRTKTSAPDPLEQLAVDVSISRDTLKTADRLEIHHLQHEAPLRQILTVEPTPPPEVTAIIPQEEPSTVESSRRGASEKRIVVRNPEPKPKHTDSSRPRPRPTNSNKAPKTDRSKAMVELKPCHPNAFDSFLQALNLSSRCQT